MTDQILVNASPIPDQIWAAVRQVAPAITTFAIGRGWLANDVAILLGVLGGVLWPIVVGQMKTRKRATQLASVAASPDVPEHVVALK